MQRCRFSDFPKSIQKHRDVPGDVTQLLLKCADMAPVSKLAVTFLNTAAKVCDVHSHVIKSR